MINPMLGKAVIPIARHTNAYSVCGSIVNSLHQVKALNGMKSQKILLGHPSISFSFSSSPKNIDSQIDKSKTEEKTTQGESPQVQTIQVSYEQFKKMKQLLKQLKSEISNLQHEGFPASKVQANAQKASSMQSQDLKSKLNEFTTNSTVFHQKAQQQQLFFNSLQQQLSFYLIKLNTKEQFTQLVDIYLKKFHSIRKSLTQENLIQSKDLLEHLKLLYLIFFRYTSLQNVRFDDSLIRKIVIELSKHINLLDEQEVEKFISILNDQSKSLKDENFRSYSISQSKLSDEFVLSIRQSLLKEDKVFSYQQRSDMNSEIMSLVSSFIFVDQRVHSKISQNCLNLRMQFTQDGSKQQKLLVYNPLNLSNLLFNSIKFCQNEQVQMRFYYLLTLSLLMSQKNFNEQKRNGSSLKLQDSLNTVSYHGFRQLQYEALVHFFEHIPQIYGKTLPIISEKNLFSTLMDTQDYFLRFSHLQRLRILYSRLSNPNAQHLQSTYHYVIIYQLQNILLAPQSQKNLFETKRSQENVLDSDDNFQFLQYKKLAMILSQIGIQMYKNYKAAPQFLKTSLMIQKFSNIIQQTLNFLNLICLEKTQLQDMWKNENQNKQKNGEKLILDLTVFEFIVNLNILLKWSVKLSGDPLAQQKNVDLLKNLITCYMAELKKMLTEFGLTTQKKFQLAQEFLIVILVGKQHSTIHKSLSFYFTESHQASEYTSLLKLTIGKDSSHKYYQQYTRISQQFKI